MNLDQEMLDIFVQESSEHLQSLERDLITLESNPADSSPLNSIFRSVHSIKGSAGLFGFDPIVKLAHVMESVMSLLRDGILKADPAMVGLLISTTDKLNLMLAQPDRASEVPCADEISGLQLILDIKSGIAEPPAATPTPTSLPSPPPTATQSADPKPSSAGMHSYPDAAMADFEFDPQSLVEGLKHGQNFYIIQTNIAAEIEAQGQTLEDFLSELASIGTVISTHPSLPENTSLVGFKNTDITLRLFLATTLEPYILCGAPGLAEENILHLDSAKLGEWVKSRPVRQETEVVAATPSNPAVEPDSRTLVPSASTVATQDRQPPANSTPASTPIDPKPLPSARRKPEETIRINVGLLDSLMNLAGEMVLGRNRLLRIAGRTDQGAENSEMQSVVQEISSVTSNLQDTIMRARLQPVGGLFGKFTRIVRDLSQKLDKEIQLEIFGDDVELDRTLLEGLSDPLTHLVRNSVDHGIESPSARAAKGKKTFGTVRLSAAHLAGRVQIEVLDDGGGMDPERLKAKAIEKGIITTDQASRMSDTDALQLIFAAGFSTAAVVSDISGRGVGMDVVKTNIEMLGGHVELDSRLGQGTRIIIRLPLTLAIVPAIIVGCHGINYALPQINVDEIVHPGEECPIKTMGGARVLDLRGQLLPVIDLSEILGHPHKESVKNETFVVVLRLDHFSYGLIVNEIISNEEIVVKPLGRHLRSVPLYSGATILGQGEIAMILDPSSMVQGRITASHLALGSTKPAEVALSDANTQRVLIFQESDGEYLAIHLTRVMRVESISADDIERIGPMECLRKNHDATLRLVQLSDILPLRPPNERKKDFFIIVPRPPFDGIGIIASRIVDSLDLADSQIDTTTLQARGLLGSAVLAERLSLVLDLDAILQMLNPSGDQQALFAQGHFLLTANSQQQSNRTPQLLKPLPPIKGQPTLTH